MAEYNFSIKSTTTRDPIDSIGNRLELGDLVSIVKIEPRYKNIIKRKQIGVYIGLDSSGLQLCVNHRYEWFNSESVVKIQDDNKGRTKLLSGELSNVAELMKRIARKHKGACLCGYDKFFWYINIGKIKYRIPREAVKNTLGYIYLFTENRKIK
jgi:hypothetical protein